VSFWVIFFSGESGRPFLFEVFLDKADLVFSPLSRLLSFPWIKKMILLFIAPFNQLCNISIPTSGIVYDTCRALRSMFFFFFVAY